MMSYEGEIWIEIKNKEKYMKEINEMCELLDICKHHTEYRNEVLEGKTAILKKQGYCLSYDYAIGAVLRILKTLPESDYVYVLIDDVNGTEEYGGELRKVKITYNFEGDLICALQDYVKNWEQYLTFEAHQKALIYRVDKLNNFDEIFSAIPKNKVISYDIFKYGNDIFCAMLFNDPEKDRYDKLDSLKLEIAELSKRDSGHPYVVTDEYYDEILATVPGWDLEEY